MRLIHYQNGNKFHSKYCPSLASAFCHFSGNSRISFQKNIGTFGAKNESTQFLTCLKRSIPFSTWVILGQVEQMIVRRSYVWRMQRVGQDVLIRISPRNIKLHLRKVAGKFSPENPPFLEFGKFSHFSADNRFISTDLCKKNDYLIHFDSILSFHNAQYLPSPRKYENSAECLLRLPYWLSSRHDHSFKKKTFFKIFFVHFFKRSI